MNSNDKLYASNTLFTWEKELNNLFLFFQSDDDKKSMNEARY